MGKVNVTLNDLEVTEINGIKVIELSELIDAINAEHDLMPEEEEGAVDVWCEENGAHLYGWYGGKDGYNEMRQKALDRGILAAKNDCCGILIFEFKPNGA